MNLTHCVAALLAATFSPLAAQLPSDPQPGAAPGSQRWIVTFASRPFDLEPLRAAIAGRAPAGTVAEVVADLDARALASHAPFTRFVAALGGRTTSHFWLVDACVAEVQPHQVAALRAQPGVAGVFPDTLRRPAGVELIKDATNAGNHNSDLANQLGFKGAGVTIAVPDSGCDENMAGSGRPHATFFVNGDVNNRTGGGIGGSRLLVNVQMGLQPADDLIGHGTAVSACAAGQVWSTPNGDPGQAPDARVASYCMADLPDGSASLSTMVATWQRIARDASTLGIKVANLSYQGSAYPEWVEQVAMDAAAQVADLAVAVMGGNDPHYAHGAVNVLAVGSVTTNTRVVSSFSAHGPLESDPQRYLPDLVANGERLVMPQADAENQDRTASGTSYSSAQVAGAMALYRSVRPAATALETRAAILAATDAVGMQNRRVTSHTRNAYGLGYLRSDRVVALALDPNTTAVTLQLTAAQPAATVRYRVVQGQWYVAAQAFNRQDANANLVTWSNIDLVVAQNGTTLGTSALPRNVHERVVFKAAATGLVDVQILARTFEPGQPAIDCALVVAPSGPAYREGAIGFLGVGCGGANLSANQVANVGLAHAVEVSGPAAASAGVMLVGASATAWGSVPLPLALAAFGAPGCALYISPDVLLPFALVNGRATVPVSLPTNPALVGAPLHQQAALLVAANPLGALFSGGVRFTIAGYLQ